MAKISVDIQKSRISAASLTGEPSKASLTGVGPLDILYMIYVSTKIAQLNCKPL